MAGTLISLSLSAFYGCVQAFGYFSTAQNLGSDGDVVRAKLLWEQHRLLQWARRANLESTTPNQRLNWSVISVLLQQQEALLTSAQELKKRYQLDVHEEDEDTAAAAEPGAVGRRRERKAVAVTIRRLLNGLKPDFYNASARTIHENNSLAKRMRWASMGREQAQHIVDDIAYFNDRLHKMLEAADQEHLQDTLAALLRDIISRCTDATELSAVSQLLNPTCLPETPTLAAAANLKQIRLIIGADKRTDETQTGGAGRQVVQNRPLRLRGPSLKIVGEIEGRVGVRRHQGIELALYKSKPVLVERKAVSEAVNSALRERLRTRVLELVLALSNITDPSFHSLPCYGFVEPAAPNNDEPYTLVYKLPPHLLLSPVDSIRATSLQVLLASHTQPSLSCRLRIARDLAETILQLHTAGWLHKGLRSANVIFITTSSTPLSACPETQPYVAGYEHARADDPKEITEMHTPSLEADLYRHPDARGRDRKGFRKGFDLYGLGAILLELVLWSELVDILTPVPTSTKLPQQPQPQPSLRQQIRSAEETGVEIDLPSLLSIREDPELLAKMAFQAGKMFCDAVIMCISASYDHNIPTDSSNAAREERMANPFHKPWHSLPSTSSANTPYISFDDDDDEDEDVNDSTAGAMASMSMSSDTLLEEIPEATLETQKAVVEILRSCRC